MNPIIGIDLGTTYSAIAKLDQHGKASINSVDGERILPSCLFSPKGDPENLVVGLLAKNKLDVDPESVLQRFKRDMGSDKVYSLPSGHGFTPVTASATILRKLVQEAEKECGRITDVVITVPANFAERQRKATIEAGIQAGLNVLNIINEPTAAALAYEAQQPTNGKLLVFDLGGGTFDVTVAEIKGGEVQCLTSEGDSELGGIDFDLAIANIIDMQHTNVHGRSLREALGLRNKNDENRSAEWQILLRESEDIKKALSKLQAQSYRYRDSPDGALTGEITRAEFEQATSGLIARTEMRVETVLDQLNLTPPEIDSVLLVGGSTRIPAVKESLKRMMGQAPSEAVNPDEAVALGAAIYAGLRTDSANLQPLQREALSKVTVTDVANHYYGTIAVNYDEERDREEDQVSIIINKDTPLPVSKTERFYTRSPDQRAINLRITQAGDKETDPEFVNIILQEEVGPLPPGRPPQQPLDFTYSYDLNQNMHVRIVDVNSGKEFNLSLTLTDPADMPVEVPDFRID